MWDEVVAAVEEYLGELCGVEFELGDSGFGEDYLDLVVVEGKYWYFNNDRSMSLKWRK